LDGLPLKSYEYGRGLTLGLDALMRPIVDITPAPLDKVGTRLTFKRKHQDRATRLVQALAKYKAPRRGWRRDRP